MEVTARRAVAADLPVLEHLYRGLEEEMTQLHRMWPLADGLAEPVSQSLMAAIDDGDALVYLGEIDGYPVGFVLGRLEPLLPQADGTRVGAIRLVYVDPDAREVAVGEEMREALLNTWREAGVSMFDAHVLPGHRLAKNFFEAGGFAARSIIMHHRDG